MIVRDTAPILTTRDPYRPKVEGPKNSGFANYSFVDLDLVQISVQYT